MRATITLVAAIFCSTISAQANFKAGLKNSLDTGVLEQAKDVYFDTVMKLIADIAIPDFADGDGNYMRQNQFILKARTDKVEIYTDVAKNAVVMKCNKLSAEFSTSSFRYDAGLVTAKGYAEVDMNTVTIGVGLAFDVQELQNGRFVPRVDSVDLDVDINRFDIKIHLHGNLWTDFASLFEIFFKGTVVDIINTSVTVALQQGVPYATNLFVKKTNGYFPVPRIDNWMIDWSTPEAAIVSDSVFSVGVKGLMFDKRYGEVEPTQAIPDMPYHSNGRPQKYQAFISGYSIDGAFDSWLSVGSIGGWSYAADVPADSTQQTTTTFSALIPGLVSKYGADRPIDLHIDFLKLGNTQVTAGDEILAIQATVDLQFWVHTSAGTVELAADVTLQDIDFAFNAIVINMDVIIHIDTINADKVIINQSNCGKISASAFRIEINSFFKISIPGYNQALKAMQIEVPHNIAGIFELSDLTLGYYDGYIYAGATPTFLPPNGAALFEVGDFEPELPKEIEIEWVMDTTNVEELVFVQ